MASGEPPAGAHITYSRQFRRCNKPDCPTCRAGGAGHGPYWYASWRQDGRKHTRYLGKQRPSGAEPGDSQLAPAPESAPTAPHPALRVRTLGGFAVWRGMTPIAPSAWAQRKATALFKCLLSAPGYKLHREGLAEWLWPEAAPVTSAKNLRQALFRLRRALDEGEAGAGYLRLEGDLLALVPAPGAEPPAGWLDAAAFQEAAVRALAGSDPRACRAALALYSGEYLPDDRYEEWAAARREDLRQLYQALLLHLAGLREAQDVLGEAARCLRAVLALDPCHEQAARTLMRIQAAAGRHTEAVRTYQQLTEALERDLALGPDVETEAQYQAVLASRQADVVQHSNLPTPLTSFLGRDKELADLSRTLVGSSRTDMPATTPSARQPPPACRLLTVIGAGGCGKTRLAIELGHELRRHYADGLWLIELAAMAPTANADLTPLAQQACDVIGVRPEPGRPALDRLLTFLGPRHTLLILDNCEHLIAACAAFAVAVLHSCPTVQIVATSREALGVLGETVWPLAPLTIPGRADGDLALQELGGYAAVRLLVERARAARPGFALQVDNRRAVVEICRQLDGIPLAIELAAARLSQLSAGELAARLHDRFRLLAAGNRTALARHQTLRAVLDWSYGLLSGAEQALLRALSVFAGNWTLAEAEAVCAGPLVAEADVLDLHARLVSKSLVGMEDAPDPEGQTRYRLLETVRQYTADHLRVCGEEAAVRDRHLSWYLALAGEAAPALRGADQRLWLARLEAEHDNLRAALAWCARDGSDNEAGLRLASGLWLFWELRGHWVEGRRWMETFLARAGGSAAARIGTLHGLGALCMWQADYLEARAAHEERLALARAIEDTHNVATALNSLGNVARLQGDYDQAVQYFEESLALQRRAGNHRAIASTLNNLGNVAQSHGDYARAIDLYEESLVLKRRIGDRVQIAYTQFNQGACYRLSGDYGRAASLFTALLADFEDLDEPWGRGAVLLEMSHLAYARGEYGVATTHLRRSLPLFQELGDKGSLAVLLAHWAAVAVAGGDPARGARLFGAADTLRAAIGYAVPPREQEAEDREIAAARHVLGAEDFAVNWELGRLMSVEHAVADALSWQP